MKLQYRILMPALIAVALVMTLLGGILINASFSARLDSEREKLAERVALAAYAAQAAYTNYAVQGVDADIGALAGEGYLLSAAEGEIPSRIYLSGKTLRAERALKLSNETYMLMVDADVSELYAHRAYLLRCYRAAYIGAILLISAIMLLITRWITRPLAELADASKALARGKLDSRAEINSRDEIGELATAFNFMADTLSDQLERQRRFIDDFSHEIKTPLAAMIGHADAIRAGKLSAEEITLSANTIFQVGKRLDALSAAMNAWILLKRDTPEMQKIRVSLLFDEILAMFPARIASKSDAVILASKPLMNSLLANLVKNALNAGARNIDLLCKLDSGIARISVSDDGCGIAKEMIAHITEPFFRVDKARSRENGGAGLGLALCKEIADMHGAQLRIKSAPGVGTIATIEIRGEAV